MTRRATPADAALLGRMLHDFNTEFESPTPSADEFSVRLARMLARDDVAAWFALDDAGGAAGFSLATVRPSAYSDGGTVTLEELYVVPPLRGNGHGGRLVAALLDWCTGLGAGEIHINVDEVDADARRFYERLGFSNIEVGTVPSRMLLYVRLV